MTNVRLILYYFSKISMQSFKCFLFLIITLNVVFAIKCDIGNGQENCQGRLGPEDRSKETFDLWFAEFNQYIEQLSKDIDFSIYDDERLRWAHTSFVQPQLMLHDKFLYDRAANIWTVDKYLNDVKERYLNGRVSSVVVSSLPYQNSILDMEELIVCFYGKGIQILV